MIAKLTRETLFLRLPYPLRILAASAEGWRMRRWRYGSGTDEMAAEALERESWSARRWERWQEDRLARLLHRAATRVPFYRDLWSRRDRRRIEDLEAWPVLRKEQVRANPEAFLADDCRPARMYMIRTSGSTGTPLKLWWSKETVQRWYALYEARMRLWNGVSRRDRWAIVGGRLVRAVGRKRPPFWVWNAGLRQLYLSAYHLSDATAAAYIDALRRHRVRFLLGYPSALHALARAALEQGLRVPRMEVVLSNAEPLSQRQAEEIGRAFQAPVRNSYGMAEIVAAASECAHGALHLWPEVGVVEERESLVCTGLLNRDMPLIRYDTGDVAHLAQAGSRCACGRGLPLLDAIEGRTDDVFVTREGRRVAWINSIFKLELPIREAQVVQETLDRIRVRLVPAAGYGAEAADVIRSGLLHRMGNVEIVVEELERIPRGANGKFRSVVSQVAVQAGS